MWSAGMDMPSKAGAACHRTRAAPCHALNTAAPTRTPSHTTRLWIRGPGGGRLWLWSAIGDGGSDPCKSQPGRERADRQIEGEAGIACIDQGERGQHDEVGGLWPQNKPEPDAARLAGV